MPSLPSPESLLALAKVTALLLVILALAPLLRNPAHRARLWTLTFLVLPLIFLSSFTAPLLHLIPKKLPTIQKDSSAIAAESPALENFSTPESFTLPPAPTLPSHPIDLPLKTDSTSPQPTLSNPPPPSPPIPWLPLIFAIGTLLSLLPFLISSIKVLRLPQSKALNPPLSLWQKIHKRSRKTPPLSFTPSPAAPFTCGIINPRVLLPDDSPSWPLRRLNSTLLHEAAHLRRRDPLVRLLATVVRAALWFHPLIWIAHRHLVAAQEQACDQHALTHGVVPADYAEDLLASATHSHLTPTEALSMAKSSQLGNRIRHILEKPKSTNMTPIILTSLLALITTLAITSIGFSKEAAPLQAEKPDTNPNKTRGDILDRNNTPLATDDQSGKRTYPLSNSAAHLTGYIGRKSRDKADGYSGKAGLENAYEKPLSKKENIKLTLDSVLQDYCYKLLSNQKSSGAIVVQDPNTGEILAIASYPTFDPNLFIPFLTTENFEDLTGNKDQPMWNRATGLYAPGSTIKPLVALAGEYAGLENPEILCKYETQFGELNYRNSRKRPDEKLRIPGALETNHNSYFLKLGIRTGEDPLRETGKLFHLNESPLASLQSSKGSWMKLPKGELFTPQMIANSSIGQGHTLMSPLHVSSITSAIASGTWHQPHLILGQKITKPPVPLIGQGKITADSLATIRSGLHQTIHGNRGSAKLATVPSLQLAGMIGTFQVSKNSTPSHSWFTGYGPFEQPKYAITVMLSGGKFAAPLAKEIFQKLLAPQ